MRFSIEGISRCWFHSVNCVAGALPVTQQNLDIRATFVTSDIVRSVLLHPRTVNVLADTAVLLDFETTGLDPTQGNRVTEVAALRVHHGKIVERFVSFSRCDVRIPSYIVKFTGIDQRMVDSAPEPREVFPKLLEFIGNDLVIAHNAWFDEAFLRLECRLLGLMCAMPEFLCSLLIARNVLPENKSHSTGCLAARLGLPFMPGAHRAAIDAEVTANILFRMCEIIRVRYALDRVDLSVLKRLAGAQAQQEQGAPASYAA